MRRSSTVDPSLVVGANQLVNTKVLTSERVVALAGEMPRFVSFRGSETEFVLSTLNH